MNYRFAVIILLVVYMAALIGYTTPTQQSWYFDATPYFVLFNALLLLLYNSRKDKNFALFTTASLASIWGILLLSVQMGWVDYTYNSDTLGEWDGGGLPFAAPALWYCITYSSVLMVNKLPAGNILKIVFSTLVSIALFAIIHQSAQSLDMWRVQAPAGINFIAPALMALTTAILFYVFKLGDTQNKIAVYIYGGLFVFFVGMVMFGGSTLWKI